MDHLDEKDRNQYFAIDAEEGVEDAESFIGVALLEIADEDGHDSVSEILEETLIAVFFHDMVV